ncbi:LysR substrate-binding domain-containing protein [Ruegeria sp. 2012CJ41-6]|uniref:LysR substrate-binding domain-containing protein n=1 Tax=Ruegeria spongiae TaxID=2942209 RepID=A0ABT0PY43_9RHOB|nr:LysR substrate-binding domain-containing protein [Ruegeria spongiae]MCL6282536.1 LysR substrate-binding domain-containing protein [Ruegeria spongiae]
MSRRHYNLPPFATLSAFEAAARHQSFKDAAQELSVTPGAVSHQIKALERELGLALFQRRHRGVELTEAGRDLFQGLSTGFSRMSQSLQALRDRSEDKVVTIGSTSAVATLWLSQAVLRFWREHPDINVNQIVRDRPFANPNDLDLFIWYGPYRHSEMDRTVLYRDRLLPVAQPELAASLNESGLATLAGQRLIHTTSDNSNWTEWGDWFRQLGHDGPVNPGIRVNNYAIALQAAQDGAGLVLGWERLIAPLLSNGALVAITPHMLRAPHRFYLHGKPDADLSASAMQLRDWIIREIRSGSHDLSSSQTQLF